MENKTSESCRSQRRRRERCLLLLLVAVWTCVIWGNSLTPAEQSAEQSSRIMALLAPLLERTAVAPELWHTLVRKLAHLTEFLLLAVLWNAALTREWMKTGRGSLLTLGACMVTALTDETIQIFVPGRASAVTDVWIDLLGAAVGVLLWRIIRAAAKK